MSTTSTPRSTFHTAADARSDLGALRTKPVWLEPDHSLPFRLLSPDEFEVFCFLLLLHERTPELQKLYYLGKTRDAGRDIVRVLQDGTVEIVQCKRYEQNFTLPDMRKELAKLCVNVFRGAITPAPQRVVFYVSSDLTAPATDLLLKPDEWKASAEQAITDYVGAKPPADLADLVNFAKRWCPELAIQNGISLTHRSRIFAPLIEEFFGVRKVVDSTAVDALSAKVDKLALMVESQNLTWAPSGMERLLSRLEKDHPGLSFKAESTAQDTNFVVSPSTPGGVIHVESPTFPNTEAGRRGREKFLRFLDEGHEIDLLPGEYAWRGPLDNSVLRPPPDTERYLKITQQIPPHKVPVQLDWLDPTGKTGASIPLTFLTLVRAGRREGEIRLTGGRLAAELSFIFQRLAEGGSHRLVFILNLPSVKAEDAFRTMELLTALHRGGLLRISDAERNAPLIEVEGFQVPDSDQKRLHGARLLLGWLTTICLEFGVDIRYPADPPHPEDARTAELLAAAIDHDGRVAVPCGSGRPSVELPKQDAGQALAEWRRVGSMNFGGQRVAAFDLFGHSLEVPGGVGLFFTETVPVETLDALENRIAETPDGCLVHIEFTAKQLIYEFNRWLVPAASAAESSKNSA